jgi:hypothetical protein
VTVKTTVFWNVTPCTLVDYLQDGDGTFLWDVGNNLPDYMASHPKRQDLFSKNFSTSL